MSSSLDLSSVYSCGDFSFSLVCVLFTPDLGRLAHSLAYPGTSLLGVAKYCTFEAFDMKG